MIKRAAHNRLDDVEVFLTPKEWIVQVAQQMKTIDLADIIVGREYDQLSFFTPLAKLSRQAEAYYPGKDRHSVEKRAELTQKLFIEYRGLKILLFRLNREIKSVCERYEPQVERAMLLIDSLAREVEFCRVAKATVAWIESGVETNADKEKILEKLKRFAISDQEWLLKGAAVTMVPKLANEIFAVRAGLQSAQDEYFDGHPILFFKNVEFTFNQLIEEITRNLERCKTLAGESTDFEFLRTAGSFDVKAMMKEANTMATIDVLALNGINGRYLTEIFCAMSAEEYESELKGPWNNQ